MPLNLPPSRRNNSTSRNDFVSALRYAARTNTWSTWDDITREMTNLSKVVATFDLEHVHTGWMRFRQGEPPDFVWDIDGRAEARPSKDHKRGFSVHLYIPHIGLRELCSSSPGLCEAITIIFDRYERAPEAAQGLLPILQTGAATLIEGSFGAFWEPSFEILGWEPRPQGLPARKPAEPATPPSQSSASTVSPATAVNDLDDDIPF